MSVDAGLPPLTEGAWTLVVLPDTQIYADAHPHVLESQTRWIATQAGPRRIRFVVHVGDVVNHNVEREWKAARDAFAHLDGRVPYLVAPGNHDYGPDGSASSRESGFVQHFPLSGFERMPTLRAVFEAGRADNTAHVLDTPDGAWLAVGLEFAPRAEVVAWAGRVLAAHPGTPALLATHAYLYSDATRYDITSRRDQRWSPHVYGVSRAGETCDGEALWQRLVRPHPQVRFVFCGHVLNSGVARLVSTREDGSSVHQLLANYQMRALGGEGYLRLVEMEPSGRACVRTYSPLLGRCLTDDDNEFVVRR